MATAVLERPSTAALLTRTAIDKIQDHLDKEAKNRRQTNLSPRELCPMQKAELVHDLMHLLA